MMDIEPDRGFIRLFDGTVFNPDDPISYLNSLKIKRDLRIQEIAIDLEVEARG